KTRGGGGGAGFLCLIAVSAGSSCGQDAGFGAGQSLAVDEFLSEAGAIKAPAAPQTSATSPARVDGDFSIIVPGISLEFYQALRILSHAAVRIVDEDGSFWQLELQDSNEYNRIKEPQFTRYGIKATLMGYSVSSGKGDVILYEDADERKSLEAWNPHLSSMPVCLNGKEPRESLAWYKDCLDGRAKVYTKKAFRFGYLSNNCSHFSEKILNKCGLANCYDYPRSSGFLHHKGILTPLPAADE
ncbi:MAG: hypothetical protein AAB262_03315, partial [Elusimicrobiota bacterium]